MRFGTLHKKIAARKNNGGFTLVEMVLYLALFISLSILLIKCLLVMLRSYTENRVNDDLLDSSSVSLERMTREIRGASSIDTSTSVFGTSPGILKLNSTDSSGNPETLEFLVAGGALELMINGTVSGNLTTSQVTVNSLIFRNITTAEGSAVRIEMTLQSVRAPSSKTMNFYDTAVLRGSY